MTLTLLHHGCYDILAHDRVHEGVRFDRTMLHFARIGGKAIPLAAVESVAQRKPNRVYNRASARFPRWVPVDDVYLEKKAAA